MMHQTYDDAPDLDEDFDADAWMYSEPQRIVLTDAQAERFAEILNAPPNPTPALIALMRGEGHGE